jgi:diguanylate cyclase (GGDEF)-like protein
MAPRSADHRIVLAVLTATAAQGLCAHGQGREVRIGMSFIAEAGSAGVAALVATAVLLLATCRARWLRVGELRHTLSAAGTAIRVAAVAWLTGAAVVALLVAGALLPAEAVLPAQWAWVARSETIAAVGLAVLLGLGDSELEGYWLLSGAILAAATTWGGASGLGALGLDAASAAPDVVLPAGILGAVMLAPGRTARRVARLRRKASGAEAIHVLLVDRNRRLVHANERARRAIGLAPRQPLAIRAREALPKALHEIVTQARPDPQRVSTPSGRILEARLVGQESGRGGAQALVLRDVTSDHRHKRRLVQLAHHDSLTGLANRRLFLERLKKVVESDESQAGRAAIFYIDLDGFKAINDSLGHAAGDALLGELADRFRANLRPEETVRFGVEPDQRALVARLAGDEFAVIAPGVPDGETAAELARFILEFMRCPLDLADRSLSPSASIGIALFPAHGRDVETLMQRADSALYLAKSRGRQRFALYEASLDEKADRARLVEEALRTALERKEMCLHYQPKVDTQTGEFVGLEALLRWQNPTLGDVSPGEFIPVAEERGLITGLGTWCLDEACRQIRAWRDAGHRVVPVSVNVSSAQFNESDLQGVVSGALKRHGVDPRQLELELTESLLLDEQGQAEEVLRDLRSIGVRIALDDFGTGYSALTYLNRFSLDVLKMDRGLLRDIENDPSAHGIASAVVGMAHSLGLHVVAEGVDTEEQLPLLRRMGCDQIQGFLFAPALPAEEVTRFMCRTGEEPLRMSPGMVAPGRRSAGEVRSEDVREPVLRSAPRPPPSQVPEAAAPAPKIGRALLVDDESQSLSTVALRLMQLGIDAHYASATDEAWLFITEESESIRLLVFPPTIDLEQARRMREGHGRSVGEARSWVVMGERPEEPARRAMREVGVDWVLWAPFNDAELRYVVKSAMALRGELSERREVRVPVDLVANIQSGDRREVAVVSTLSARGAFVEMSDPLAYGSSLRIQIALGHDSVRAFARVVHVAEADPSRPGDPSGVGVAFYGFDRNEERLLRKAVSELRMRYLP